jgi:hypothetical protein
MLQKQERLRQEKLNVNRFVAASRLRGDQLEREIIKISEAAPDNYSKYADDAQGGYRAV